MVYMDGCRMAVRWTKWSASVYDHHGGKMQEVFAAFLQSESKEAVAQALALWKQLGRMGYDGRHGGEAVKAHEVSPKINMLDAAEGPIQATEEAFGHLKAEGRGRQGRVTFTLRSAGHGTRENTCRRSGEKSTRRGLTSYGEQKRSRRLKLLRRSCAHGTE